LVRSTYVKNYCKKHNLTEDPKDPEHAKIRTTALLLNATHFGFLLAATGNAEMRNMMASYTTN
jgi:hypothetical protein